MNEDKTVFFGKVGKPHGIKGEVNLYLENPNESTLATGEQILLDGETYLIESIRFGNKVIAKFSGIDDIDTAKEIVNKEITVERDTFPQLDEDEVYLHDLMGLKAIDQNQNEVGTIHSTYFNGVQDILCIKGKREIELPFVNHFFPEFDLDAKIRKVNYPEMID